MVAPTLKKTMIFERFSTQLTKKYGFQKNTKKKSGYASFNFVQSYKQSDFILYNLRFLKTVQKKSVNFWKKCSSITFFSKFYNFKLLLT